ncbi:recombinase family protein [Staphylococcus aureus]|uniref:recombinase family protein n=1 Tax=Staphylococcus aureus TaxID=1280 RepID=UPI000ACFD3F0|nr:recombinase family protein [Staphylococcus aureus]MDG6650633.1 recombinase family protein [Staphylococcus aureus]MDG6653303.1 recombinase family protein [Staphylococcus aureus]MDG6658531.1 recombinase family protein [Staphylococcus aureus]MDG6661161.1 recombinase family protein [Staphylococcus aureus]MDG6663817.1 recombinase family protein [Staphylococcus aureus]
MAKIGYARVSTKDQSLDGQIDTLKEFGCERIFSEKISGRKVKRTELDKCLDYLREGDTLVIYKLDRLGRTTKQLIELSQWFDDNGIDLQIIDMNISTKDAMSKMFFTMMSAFAELEANLLSERTKKGLASARARGRLGGRPSLPDHKKREIKFLYDEQMMTGEEIAKKTGVSRSTVYRVVRDYQNDTEGKK